MYIEKPLSRLMFLICLVLPLSIHAQKTDWVFLEKGNRLLCEIKQLELGKLRVKGYEMGTVKIEWDAVDSIYSETEYMIRLEDGNIFRSRLDTSWYSNFNYPWESIIEIYPIKDELWSRIEGEIDMGANYTKSSEILQLNVYGDLTYHSLKNAISLNVSNITTLDNEDAEQEKTRKSDISLVDDLLLPDNLLLRGMLGFNQNILLGLNGRLFTGIGVGKEMLHNQKARLLLGVGARANREWSTDDISNGYNAEGAFLIEFQRFSFDFPEIDIESSLTVLPSLTDWGRIRADTQIKAKIEIIADFFFSVKVYHSLDSRPIDETAQKSDWGLNTSVGYNF